jgi:hypothetical protein
MMERLVVIGTVWFPSKVKSYCVSEDAVTTLRNLAYWFVAPFRMNLEGTEEKSRRYVVVCFRLCFKHRFLGLRFPEFWGFGFQNFLLKY